MRHAVSEATSAFTGTEATITDVVRLAVSEAYAHHVIPAILTPLIQQNLHLEIELSVSNQTDNLLRHYADIVVRFICPQQEGVIAVKVGQAELGLFAHEEYLSRHGIPFNLELEASSVLSGHDRELLQLARFVRG
jgi:DNA-binding transcriptional LysR family regulator